MRWFNRLWKLIVFDTLGVLVMIAAVLTGWLPGPGFVPLFIIGLSLLAINHAWAKRYMKNMQKLSGKLNDIVFSTNPKVRIAYDILSPLGIISGIYIMWRSDAAWLFSVSILLIFGSIILFMGNRGRWQRISKIFKR